MATGASTRIGRRMWAGLTDLLRRDAMRPIVRWFTALHTRLYRVTGGRAQSGRYPTLLLTVVGRRSGRARTVPLVYVADGSDFLVAAAYSGADRDPTWWLNLRAAGTATVQVGRSRLPVTAAETPLADRPVEWARLAAMYPPFDEYQTRTDRSIPVIRLSRTATGAPRDPTGILRSVRGHG